MSRIQTTLSLALGLVAAGSLAYAWHLHGLLLEAEVSRAASAVEQSRLQKRVTKLEREEAAFAPAPPRPAPEATRAASAPAGVASVAMPPRDGRRGNLMQTPEMQRAMQLDRRSSLDIRFSALFRKLNLPPAQLEKLKDLLVERQAAAMDVYEAARTVGGNNRGNREELQAMVAESEAQIDRTIESTFGQGVYSQYKQYEETAPQRAIVNQVERRLSYTSTPLTTDQSDRLVSLLATSAAGTAGTASERELLENGPRFRSLDSVSSQALEQSRSFLSSDQVAALQQLRTEAEQRTQLRQQARERANAGNPAQPPGKSGP